MTTIVLFTVAIAAIIGATIVIGALIVAT